MELTHPYARRETAPPAAVTVAGETHAVADGVVSLPDSQGEQLLDAWTERYDVAAATLRRDDADGPTDSDTPDGEECPHCGRVFSPNGLPAHKAACDEAPADEQE